MQTIKEAAELAGYCPEVKKYNCGRCPLYERAYECPHSNIKDAFESGVEFAETWVSIKEELPEISAFVICKRESIYFSGQVISRTLKEGDKLMVQGEYQGMKLVEMFDNFTHWRLIHKE